MVSRGAARCPFFVGFHVQGWRCDRRRKAVLAAGEGGTCADEPAAKSAAVGCDVKLGVTGDEVERGRSPTVSDTPAPVAQS